MHEPFRAMNTIIFLILFAFSFNILKFYSFLFYFVFSLTLFFDNFLIMLRNDWYHSKILGLGVIQIQTVLLYVIHFVYIQSMLIYSYHHYQYHLKFLNMLGWTIHSWQNVVSSQIDIKYLKCKEVNIKGNPLNTRRSGTDGKRIT